MDTTVNRGNINEENKGRDLEFLEISVDYNNNNINNNQPGCTAATDAYMLYGSRDGDVDGIGNDVNYNGLKNGEEQNNKEDESEIVERNEWESGVSTPANDNDNGDDEDDNSNAFHMLGDSDRYKDRYLEKQHSLFVMVLNEDGTHSYKDMRRDEILRECRQDIYTLSGGRISNPRVVFRGATQPRDIRVLDPGFSIIENAVLVRRHAILLKLNPIHAVVLRNKLILVVPEGADKILHDLQSKLKALSVSECAAEPEQIRINNATPIETGNVDKPQEVKKKLSVKWVGDADGHQKVEQDGIVGVLSKDSIQSTEVNAKKKFGLKKPRMLKSYFSHDEKEHYEEIVDPPSSIPVPRSATPSYGGDEYDPSSSTTSGSARTVIPFELRALEAIFLILSNILEREFDELHSLTMKTTKNLIKKSSGAFLERLRQRKNDVAKMLSRIRAIRDAVESVLEDDADLALMRLTKVFQNPSRYSHANVEEWSADHEDVELLLENYMQIFEDIIARADLIQQDIMATENIINLRLDTARNSLLQVNLMVSSVTSAAAVATLIAGM